MNQINERRSNLKTPAAQNCGSKLFMSDDLPQAFAYPPSVEIADKTIEEYKNEKDLPSTFDKSLYEYFMRDEHPYIDQPIFKLPVAPEINLSTLTMGLTINNPNSIQVYNNANQDVSFQNGGL